MWERVHNEWKDKGVVLVGVGLLDTFEAARGFVRKHRLTFPNGYDSQGKVAKLYGFTYQPYSAFITPEGLLARAGFGPTSEAELVAMIKTIAPRK